MAIATRRLDGRGVREVNVVPRAAALAVSQHSVLEAAITLLVFSSRSACRARLGYKLPGSRCHFTYAHSRARRRAWRLGTNGHRPGGCGLCTEMKRAHRRPYHLIGNATTTSTLMQAAPRRDWVTPIANRPADLRRINPGLILQ